MLIDLLQMLAILLICFLQKLVLGFGITMQLIDRKLQTVASVASR